MSTQPPAGARPTVRAADETDRTALAGLLRSAGLPLDGLDEAWRTVVAVVPAGTAAAPVVVGGAALERHGCGSDTALLLRSVVVAPPWRGTGTGARLVRHLLDGAASTAAPQAPVALLTETAGDWFGRLGFRVVAREDLPTALSASVQVASACPASAVAMLRARDTGGAATLPSP
ncbi:GNAT family N-acetyltransferase [Aquipuribacter sp. SD81]|uniref:GNAT family N-acetyltransferase n=1 Tax=Aquipuribacter sp. SD81 TaxID=3127703 RepID=UPI003019D890